MTAQVPRLSLAVDPLIQEAKRRAARRRFLLAAAFVAVAAAVAGTVALRSLERPTPVVVVPPACRAAQLQLVAGRGGVAAGTYLRDFALRNASAESCAVRGWPSLQLVLVTGKRIAPRVERLRYFSSGVPNHPVAPRTIRLGPGATASFNLSDQDWNYKSERACVRVRTMLVTPPRADRPLSVPLGIGGYCAPLRMAPLVAGTQAPAP
jgi:uncharacterized protein DUF4232